MTVELPKTTDCDSADAICTNDSRPLSNSLSATVEGPSTSNAVAATLDLLQGPLTARVSRDEDPVQPLALVASRPTMAVAGVRTDTSERPNVLLRVASDSVVLDIDADYHATTREAVEGTGNDAGSAFRSTYLARVPATQVRPDATFSVLVDPDNAQAESDETDNELVVPLSDLRVVQPPTFKITLVPIVRRGAAPFAFDDGPEPMLAEAFALLPIGAHRVTSAAPLGVDGRASSRQMLDALHALWNREADPNEFFHGLYRADQNWPEGLALVGGPVAVSSVPEEGDPDDSGWLVANGLAHNFGLGGEPAPDSSATYGWSSASERFFSPFDDEIMAGVGGSSLFISRAHYERAMEWMSRPGAVPTPVGGSEPTSVADAFALTGGIDASGAWYLHSAERSPKPPRAASAGEYSAVVYDENGIPLLEQPLRIVQLSTGPGGVWALRVPNTVAAARALRIWGRGGDLLLDADLVFEQASPPELREVVRPH
ncbi:MAG: hypothetical protein F4Y41_18175 [Gammaproteobacteria bacterium]|nr:hypothetical protein [Gammaproteobacteria bacterium]